MSAEDVIRALNGLVIAEILEDIEHFEEATPCPDNLPCRNCILAADGCCSALGAPSVLQASDEGWCSSFTLYEEPLEQPEG